jgi:2-succinyl-6-hydroxy-2,4-cyclohexadiene-1-carboxylate synthase
MLVFVPGFMQRGEAWAAVAGRTEKRYPSTCLDFRAYGWSARLAELTAAGHAGSVVVGYSMGGRLALHAALAEPARFAALVTVGASAGIDDPRARETRRRADEELAAWIERHPIDQVVKRWERTPALADQATALVDAQRPGRLRHDPAGLAGLLRSGGQGALEPVWGRLHELPMPVLALAGAHDATYAAAASRLATLLPVGRSALVPGAGHAPQLERPEAVADLLLEFLDQHFGEGVFADLDAEARSGRHGE